MVDMFDVFDGRNPAPIHGCFMMFYPIIYTLSTIQGGAGFLPPTVCLMAKDRVSIMAPYGPQPLSLVSWFPISEDQS